MKKDVYNLSKPQEAIWLTEENSRSSSKIKKLKLDLSKEFFKDIEAISKATDVSSYSVFLAGLYILLYRYTYQNNLKIVLKKDINSEQHFFDFAKSVYKNTENTIANQLHDFLTLDNNSSSLSVVFSYNSLAENALTAINPISNFDLNFEIVASANILSLEFNTNLFKLSTAKSLLSHYFFVLKQILKNTNCKISEFEMFTPEENKLLEKFNKKGILLNNDAFLSLFNTNGKKLMVHILDNNLKHVPIGNIRGNLYM